MRNTLEASLRRRIQSNFPQIHDVDFEEMDELTVLIRALPVETVCPIELSRIVASKTHPRSYKLKIRYVWTGRLRSLVGNRRQVNQSEREEFR